MDIFRQFCSWAKDVPSISHPSIREIIEEEYPDIPLLFMGEEEYDEAIIGVVEGIAHELAVAYDFDKVIDASVSMGMTYEEAIEHYGNNQSGAYYGKHTWVFVRSLN